MKNKKFKKFEVKVLCFILIATLITPMELVFAAEESQLFGTKSLFETEGETIKNITPEWFNNYAPWTTPKAKFFGENFVASGNKVYRRETGGSAGGSEWKEATPKWENDFTKKITALEAYNGKLYLGTYSRSWAEVWESADGTTWKNITPVEERKLTYTDPENNEIQIVGAPSFEVLPTMWGGSYFEVSFLKEFNGYLYAGLASGTGAEIFRYSNSTAGGKTVGWEKVSPAWSNQNVNIKAATVFNNELLIGTYNLSGAQLWRLSLDGVWSQISFGGTDGIRINDLEVSGDALYIGILKGNGGSEIIRIVGSDNFADNSAIVTVTPKKWEEFSQFEIINLEAVGGSEAVGGLEAVGGALFAEIFVDRAKIEIWELKDDVWYKFEGDQDPNSDLAGVVNGVSETTESSSIESPAEQTPSEILVAINAVFQEIKDFVSALGLSVEEETQTLIAESNFTVLGDTTLADVTVTGDLAVGMIKIDSLENSIGIVGASCYSEITGEIINEDLCEMQALKLQAGLSGNVDVFDGKIVLTPAGDVVVEGTVKARKYEVETVEGGVAGASAGRTVILAGEVAVKVEVGEGVLTEESMIMVTPEIPVAVGSRRIAEVGEEVAEAVVDSGENVMGSGENGTFEITLSEPLTEDLTVSWWIIN